MAYFNGSTWVSSTPSSNKTGGTTTTGSINGTPTTETTYKSKYGTTTYVTPTKTVTPSDDKGGGTPATTTSSTTSPTYDYASAMLDAINAQYQAQENARIAKLNALKVSNKESADRTIGQYNNQANKNARQIANLTKNGTNGAMLSQQLQNNLWRDNGIHSTLNTMNTANANGESASYDTQAENLGNLTNSINNLASTYLANMDTDSQRKFISRLQDLYK